MYFPSLCRFLPCTHRNRAVAGDLWNNTCLLRRGLMGALSMRSVPLSMEKMFICLLIFPIVTVELNQRFLVPALKFEFVVSAAYGRKKRKKHVEKFVLINGTSGYVSAIYSWRQLVKVLQRIFSRELAASYQRSTRHRKTSEASMHLQ